MSLPTAPPAATPTPLGISPSPTAALQRLLSELRPVLVDAVDMLHVAAILESRGITDELAQSQYGSEDVFALADRLHSMTQGRLSADGRGVLLPHPGAQMIGPRTRPLDHATSIDRSTVGHGAIYLLPALSMPALLVLAGARHAVLALIVGGAVGWIWVAVTSWRAYAEWSRHGRQPAVLLMAGLSLLGVAVGAGVGLILVFWLGLPLVAGVISMAVTTTQVSTILLFFQRKRLVLVAILLVPAATGVAHLAAPRAVSAWAVLTVFLAAYGVALLLGSAPLLRITPRDWPRPRWAWITLPGTAGVITYGVAAVAFLLLPQAVLMGRTPHAVMALAGLFLTMGLVEWRAARLSALLRNLLGAEGCLSDFRRRAARLVGVEGLLCLLTATVLTTLLLLVLRELERFDAASVAVGVTGVLLAPVYLLAQVLANAGAYLWLTGSFGLGVVVEATTWFLDAPVTTAFAAAAGTTLVALLLGLLTLPVHRFR